MHGSANDVKNFRLSLGERARDERPSSRFMSAAVKSLGDLIALYVATATETQLETAAGLFDKDDRELNAGDCQRQVDGVFGISQQGTGDAQSLL